MLSIGRRRKITTASTRAMATIASRASDSGRPATLRSTDRHSYGLERDVRTRSLKIEQILEERAAAALAAGLRAPVGAIVVMAVGLVPV
jgi:hypothetical protein